MITAQFIEFDTHPGIIFNVSQIVSVEKTAGPILGKQQAYEALGMSTAAVHTIRICLVGREAIDLAFDSEAQCTDTFKMIKMALTPRAVPQPGLSASPRRMTSSAAPKKPKPLRAPQKPLKGEW